MSMMVSAMLTNAFQDFDAVFLKLNKANTSDTEAPFLDLHLSISNGLVKSKIYNKRDDIDFVIVNFPLFRWRCSTSPF